MDENARLEILRAALALRQSMKQFVSVAGKVADFQAAQHPDNPELHRDFATKQHRKIELLCQWLEEESNRFVTPLLTKESDEQSDHERREMSTLAHEAAVLKSSDQLKAILTSSTDWLLATSASHDRARAAVFCLFDHRPDEFWKFGPDTRFAAARKLSEVDSFAQWAEESEPIKSMWKLIAEVPTLTDKTVAWLREEIHDADMTE